MTNDNQKIAYKILKGGRISKQQLATYLGCEERQARHVISGLSKNVPVISTSYVKGYKVGTHHSEMEEAMQALAELDSRIRELILREVPLKKFVKWCKRQRETGANDTYNYNERSGQQ